MHAHPLFKTIFQWPFILTAPLLLVSLGLSVFFVGTDSILFAPAFMCLSAYCAITLWPGLKDGFHVPRTATFAFVMAFWGYLIISHLWSTVPFVSTLFTLILSLLPGFFIVTLLAQNPERWARYHGFVLWLVIGGFALWAMVQFIFFFEQFGPRIKHPMLNPNNLAGLFNLALFPALGFFFYARDHRMKILSYAVVILFYAALIVTQSRGAVLSAFISLLILLPFVVFKNPHGVPWKRLSIMAFIIVAVPFFANFLNDGALERNLIGDTLKNMGSAIDRFYLWESTWHMVKDYFWLGTGLASFYFYYPSYRHHLDRSDGFFAHMDPLQFWAEMGVLAPILFYGVLICILLRTVKAVRASSNNFDLRLKIITPFCGMLALTGHTHITFHFYMPAMLLPLSALLSYWYVMTETALSSQTQAAQRFLFKPEKYKKVLMMAAIFVPLVLANVWIARAGVATYQMKNVETLVNKGDMAGAQEKLHEIGQIAPPSYSRVYEFKARYAISEFSQFGGKLGQEERAALYNFALMNIQKAQSLNTHFTSLWDLEARLYFTAHGILLPDGRDKAIALLEKVVKANPLASNSRVALSDIYKRQGEFKKAMATLDDGMKWPRPKGVPDISYLLATANMKRQLGDMQAYRQIIGMAEARARLYGIALTRQ